MAAGALSTTLAQPQPLSSAGRSAIGNPGFPPQVRMPVPGTPPFLLVHLPKCAGTSARNALYRLLHNHSVPDHQMCIPGTPATPRYTLLNVSECLHFRSLQLNSTTVAEAGEEPRPIVAVAGHFHFDWTSRILANLTQVLEQSRWATAQGMFDSGGLRFCQDCVEFPPTLIFLAGHGRDGPRAMSHVHPAPRGAAGQLLLLVPRENREGAALPAGGCSQAPRTCRDVGCGLGGPGAAGVTTSPRHTMHLVSTQLAETPFPLAALHR